MRLLIFVFLFQFSQSEIFSQIKNCDCAGIQYKGDSLVFYGRVLDITTNNVNSGIKATFGVQKVFLGSTDPVTVISSTYPGIDCGFEFKKDSVYLVYAFRGRSIKTGACTNTRRIQDSTEIPVALGLGYIVHRDLDKANSGILRLSLAALAGFVLLIGVLFLRKYIRRK